MAEGGTRVAFTGSTMLRFDDVLVYALKQDCRF